MIRIRLKWFCGFVHCEESFCHQRQDLFAMTNNSLSCALMSPTELTICEVAFGMKFGLKSILKAINFCDFLFMFQVSNNSAITEQRLNNKCNCASRRSVSDNFENTEIS